MRRMGLGKRLVMKRLSEMMNHTEPIEQPLWVDITTCVRGFEHNGGCPFFFHLSICVCACMCVRVLFRVLVPVLYAIPSSLLIYSYPLT
jgi:hypothetical protein